jgi:hypothetical protein
VIVQKIADDLQTATQLASIADGLKEQSALPVVALENLMIAKHPAPALGFHSSK